MFNGYTSASFNGRTVAIGANADINSTGWTWGDIQNYIKQAFAADGWDIKTSKARYGVGSTADVSITACVNNAYSNDDVYYSAKRVLEAIRFNNPLYGTLPLFTRVDVAVQGDLGGCGTQAQTVQNTQTPVQSNSQQQSPWSNFNLACLINPALCLINSGDPLVSSGNGGVNLIPAIKKGFTDTISESLGITTPTLILGGIVIGVLLLRK